MLSPSLWNNKIYFKDYFLINLGSNYYIKIKMNDANCRKQCTIEECDLVIYERVWVNFTNLTKFDCTIQNNQAMNLGGFADLNAGKNSDVLVGQSKQVAMNSNSQAALDKILTGINSQLNSYLHKVQSVNEVKKQMVAGILYRFKFQIAKTTCDIQQIGQIDTCEIPDKSVTLKCTGSILDKVWMAERYSSIMFDCN